MDGFQYRYLKERQDELKAELFGEDGQGGEIAAIHRRMSKLEDRIKPLENIRWWVLGAIAALVGGPTVGRIIADLLETNK